jgi:hypothetical protein
MVILLFRPYTHHSPKDAIKREYYTVFKILDNRFIVAGDYDAKYTSKLISPKERQLFKAIGDLNLAILSTGELT